MKGIVVEIKKNEAIMLTDDGLFTKVKNQNYTVGQAIKVQESKKSYSKWIAGAASVAAAFAVCTIGTYAWFTPTDYVSLDVNPSVEYTINTFDRILEVKAVNDDGEEILDNLDLKNMTIEDAVKETLDKLMADGYLTDDPNGGVVITTSNDEMGDAEQLAAELEQEIQTYLDDQEGITAKVDAEAVAPGRVAEARELGVTPGKLNLVEKLQATTTGAISMEEWLTKPVKEINKAIKENKKVVKDNIKSTSNPDQEDAATKGGIDWKGKPEKQEKERPSSKSVMKESNTATISGVSLKDQKPKENGHDNKKDDSVADQKTDQPKDDEMKADQKKDETGSNNDKPPKDSGSKDNGNSSNKEKDQKN